MMILLLAQNQGKLEIIKIIPGVNGYIFIKINHIQSIFKHLLKQKMNKGLHDLK